MNRLLPVVGTVSALILGAVLLFAAFAKSLDPALFAESIDKLGFFPASFSWPLAILGVAFEAALGIALLSNWRNPLILTLTTLTFLFFVAVVARQLTLPADEQSSCGCFGSLVQNTPQQELYLDGGLTVLSLLAWLGRRREEPVPSAKRQWWRPLLTGAAGVVAALFALIAPSMALDDLTTRLRVGATLDEMKMDEVLPEAQSGTHLILLIDRKDEATRARVPGVNQHLVLKDNAPVKVWGLAENNEDLAAEFLWTAAPAFDIKGAPAGWLRTLYRKLPRAALIKDKKIVKVWNEIPDEATLDALARGEMP